MALESSLEALAEAIEGCGGAVRDSNTVRLRSRPPKRQTMNDVTTWQGGRAAARVA